MVSKPTTYGTIKISGIALTINGTTNARKGKIKFRFWVIQPFTGLRALVTFYSPTLRANYRFIKLLIAILNALRLQNRGYLKNCQTIDYKNPR